MSAIEFTLRAAAILPCAAALLLGGCETAPADDSETGAPTATKSVAGAETRGTVMIPAATVNALANGMSGDQVRALLGRPQTTRPFRPGGPGAEVWVYRISYVETTRQVAASTRDVPAFNPITGDQINVAEPVYQNQYTRTYRTLELLLIDGRLIERKAGTEVQRTFN